MHNDSRRDFLKTAAASAVATGLYTGHALGAGNGPLKVGLIGCGGRGTGAAVNALKADANVKLFAMSDAFADRLEDSLKQLQNEKACAGKIDVPAERRFSGFDGYQKVIESCDVVLLCTPPHFRPAHLKAAVDAGKHVFCEKPMAVDGPGVRSVLESARKAKDKGLSLVAGFCFRYHAPKRETVRRVHDGMVGDVLAVQCNYNTSPLWHRGSDPSWSAMEYQMRNWYYFTWLSGDFIVEQHIHNLDKAAWVLRDATPISAVGMGGRQQRTDAKFGHIYDHFSTVFEYAGGVKVFSYCRQMAGCQGDISDHVIGSKGQAQLMAHTVTPAGGGKPWTYSGDGDDMYQTEHNELFTAIRSERPINDGVTMAHSTLMGIMGRMAAYTGKKVTWKQAMESKEDLSPAAYDMKGDAPKPVVAVPGKTKLV